MKKTVTVKAQPDGLWTLVDVLWAAPLRLEFAATGAKWRYAPANECDGNGDLEALIDPVRAILATAPVGALIGKIGGSSAGAKDGAALFLVGKYLALQTKPEWTGALYLTINDDPKGLSNNAGAIDVDVTIESI